MDFLDPKKKRAQRTRLIIGYILIAIAIALVTLILVFQTYGYDLDRKTGAIIQNGLMFISAQPEPADIYLNGKQYKSLSDAKLVLPSSVYKVELKHNGYRDWTRTVSLAGGTIERLVYPFLFPANLDIKKQQSYASAPTFATQSPDRHWLLVQQPDKPSVFDEFDSNTPKTAAVALTLPTDLLTAGANSKLTTVEWSNDNRHVLVRHDWTGGNEFIMIDRQTPASSFSVNKTFKAAPTEVTIRDKNFEQLYLYDATTAKLDAGNVKDATVTPVLSNVLAYKSHGSDMILYASDLNATAGKTRVMLKDGDNSYLLKEVTASSQYLLALAQYSNHWYMAAGSQAENRVYVYKDPQSIIKGQTDKTLYPATVLRVTSPNWIDFSANTQFITIENGSEFATYDAEYQRNYHFDMKKPLDAAAPHASWMDGNRLMINSDGKMVVTDYDGLNQQTLAPNLAGIVPFFDRDYKLMYNLAPNSGAFALTHINLNLSATPQ